MFSASSKLLKEKKTYELRLTVKPDQTVSYHIYAIVDEENGEVKRLIIKEAKFVDDIGEIPIQGRSLEKLRRILKENLVGNFDNGFALNKPIYRKLKKFVP